MPRSFDEKLFIDGDGKKMSTFGQTPTEGPMQGKEELVGVMAGYEYDIQTKLWYPPGYLPDDRVGKPRVKVRELENKVDTLNGKIDALTDENGNWKVSQSGSIESTKTVSRSGDLATSTDEIFVSIEQEIIIHDITAYFEESAITLRFHLEFWNGTSWERYKFPLSSDYFGSEITPGTCSHNGIFEQAGTTNFIKMKKNQLHVKGIRIFAGNYTNAAKRLDIGMLYSEV
ncbi:hypothetical protein [Orenia marismortui]|uniref:Uncharacterized protein n=1 Tax=Orenia marismortui TaxID=46469 RepID=A0A4R8H513_9FIRM|nr:hypothetical protein [Orenia marismortui]TDX52135.1 hypothetical protein C7959_10857 [Orenia marismortui]